MQDPAHIWGPHFHHVDLTQKSFLLAGGAQAWAFLHHSQAAQAEGTASIAISSWNVSCAPTRHKLRLALKGRSAWLLAETGISLTPLSSALKQCVTQQESQIEDEGLLPGGVGSGRLFRGGGISTLLAAESPCGQVEGRTSGRGDAQARAQALTSKWHSAGEDIETRRDPKPCGGGL